LIIFLVIPGRLGPGARAKPSHRCGAVAAAYRRPHGCRHAKNRSGILRCARYRPCTPQCELGRVGWVTRVLRCTNPRVPEPCSMSRRLQLGAQPSTRCPPTTLRLVISERRTGKYLEGLLAGQQPTSAHHPERSFRLRPFSDTGGRQRFRLRTAPPPMPCRALGGPASDQSSGTTVAAEDHTAGTCPAPPRHMGHDR
jgi:hypothetical protein